jgi:hypothetical protein
MNLKKERSNPESNPIWLCIDVIGSAVIQPHAESFLYCCMDS